MGYRFIVRLTLCLIWIFAGYKWGDLKNWKKYYPTMLFLGFGDAIYNLVFANMRLWSFKSDFLQPYFNELLVIFTIFFSTALIYLSNYPENGSWAKKIAYMSLWTGIYTITEVITYKLDMIYYTHGWSIPLSVLFNVFIFAILRIHHKKPVIAWIIGFVVLGVMIKVFKIPVIV